MRHRQGWDCLKMRSPAVIVGVWVTFLISSMTSGPVVSGVFRCPDGSDGVIFQQIPCAQGVEVELDIRTTEWVASPQGRSGQGRGSAKAGSRDQAALGRAARAERKQKQACWKAGQRIERIEAELRRGYKPSRGERLRQQRREQSDYLREFCR